MKTLLRSWWFAATAVIYVGFASLKATPLPWLAWTLILGAPVVLWLTWRYTGTGRQLRQPEHVVLTDCKRAAVTGSLLLACARTGPVGHSGFDVAAAVGVGMSVVAACLALANIAGSGGLLPPPRATRSRDAAIMASMLWGIATALPAIRALVPASVLALDPVAIDYGTVTAAMASLLLLVAVTARLTFLRRLELGVSDRATSSLVVSIVALLATIPALLLDVAAPDRAVPVVLSVTCLFHVWSATATDPRRVTASLRVSLAILMFLAPVVLLLAVLARSSPLVAPLYVMASAALSVLVGLAASRLSRPLAPEQSRWLDAIHAASEAALEPDPTDALRATLLALKPIAPGTTVRVELWRVEPPSLLYVDIAGQLHEESTSLPPSVIALAEDEPERTLRADVLAATQVRSVAAREALSYFSTRNTYCTTLLTHEAEPLGLLALPHTKRNAPLSLEECTALRRLCDRVESVLAITSAQARARERELAARNRVTALEADTQRLDLALTAALSSHQRFAERFAERLRPQTYSSRSRQLEQDLERAGSHREALTLLVAPGVEPLPWASLYHLSSPRRQGPFVVFDATSSDAASELWDCPARSPVAAALSGTWVLLNPQALTLPQQDAIAQSLGRFRASTSATQEKRFGAILVAHVAAGADRGELALAESLRAFFPPEDTLFVPPLRERPEDLRATLYERTARIGLALRGKPVGVAPSALAELLDYEWPLNDVEIASTVWSLVLATEGDSVTDLELDRVGFSSQPRPSARPASDDPSATSRRRPRPAPNTSRPRDR